MFLLHLCCSHLGQCSYVSSKVLRILVSYQIMPNRQAIPCAWRNTKAIEHIAEHFDP